MSRIGRSRAARRTPRGVLLLGALCLHGAPPAAGFESNVPGHRIHEAITREAAAAVGWEGAPLSSLVDAVNAPDFAETHVVSFRGGRLRFLTPNPAAYAPEHHFDRGPGTSHAAAFLSGMRYIHAQRAAALAAAARGDDAATFRALGRALHALQDFFSHSNFVDLDADDRVACLEALRAGPPPASLRITAYFPDATDPEDPRDPERYTHGAHSKDAPRKNADAAARPGGPDSPSNFERARDVAGAETRAFLAAFRAGAAAPPMTPER